jgi:hypothetical protein
MEFFFICNFFQFLVIKALDPYWIRIRIAFQPKMLDSDEMNSDPHTCVEGNAKCRHLKKLTCKGTSRQVFLCLRPRTPYPPPPLTCVVYLFTQGRGGGVEPERRGVGKKFTQQGRNYQHDGLYTQSINLINTCPKAFWALPIEFRYSHCCRTK